MDRSTAARLPAAGPAPASGRPLDGGGEPPTPSSDPLRGKNGPFAVPASRPNGPFWVLERRVRVHVGGLSGLSISIRGRLPTYR